MNQSRVAAFPTFSLAVGLTCSVAAAQFGEIRALSITDSSGAFESIARDFDGDGIVDVLTGSRSDGNLAIYRGLGSGAFGTAQLLDERVSELGGMDALDLEGDGDVDPICISPIDGIVKVYENLGSGRYAASRAITSAVPGGADVACIDIDGDLDQDLVVAAPASGGVVWFENLGGGAYSSSATSIGNFAGARSVGGADLDGDGDLDVLVSSAAALTAFENSGASGAWGTLPTTTDTYTSVDSFRAGDVDGDGALDLIVVGAPGAIQQAAWYRRAGSGYGGRQPLLSSSLVRDAYVADIDGDGDQDVVVAAESPTSGAGFVHALENLGSGVIGATTATSNFTAASLAVADLNGDGIDDVLCTSAFEERAVHYHAGNGSGGWLASAAISSRGTIAPQDTLLADLDGDGQEDLVVASYQSGGSGANPGSVTWYAGLGGARFGPARWITEDGFRIVNVRAVDLNGDGDLDLVTSGDPMAIQENLGGGLFAPRATIPVNGNRVRTVEVGDLDGDGLPDIAASTESTGVVWLRNLGGNTFAPFQQIAGSGLCLGIDIEDMDGDGDEDLLFIEASPAGARWSENLGGGTFGSATTVVGATESFQEPKSITARDMDSDGVMDIVAGGFRSTFFVRGTGGGTFASAVQVAVLPAWNEKSFAIGDVDGDGALDIVVKAFLPSGSSFPIRWSRNIGAGQFSSTQLVTSDAAVPEFLMTADLDGDGDEDVIYGSRTNGVVSWVESLALGTPFADQIGSAFCGPAPATSTGGPARMSAEGSDRVQDNDVTLVASGLPSNVFGLFVAGPSQGFVPSLAGGDGNLCLGGPLARFNGSLQNSGASGSLTHPIDLQSIPLFPAMAAQPGETWYFQAWFRDSNPTATSNLSDGLALRLK